MKYNLPMLLVTAIACSPKGEYLAPVKAEPLVVPERSLLEPDQLVQKPLEQILGEQMVLFAGIVAKQGICQTPKPEIKDCSARIFITKEILVTRALYESNSLTLEFVTIYSGGMADIQTPTGEIKPGKVETKWVEFITLNPPRHLYRRRENRLTLYDKNQAGELEIARVIDVTKCFDSRMNELKVTAGGQCVLP